MNHTGAVAFTFRTSIHSTTARRHGFFFSLRLPIAASALALAFLAGAIQTHAQTTSVWVNAAGGTFTTAANWSPAVVPTDGGVALFTNGASYTVYLNADSPNLYGTIFSNNASVVTIDPNHNTWHTTNRFILGLASSTSTVYLADGTLSVAWVSGTYTAAALRIADATTNLFNCMATMIVTNGTLSADVCAIGTASNSVGTLIITGTGQYQPGTGLGTLTVGESSAGNRLIVTNGGKLTSFGTLTVGNSLNASNNFMLISDPTSAGTIQNNGLKMVGNGGLVIISNGASLYVQQGGTIGGNSSFNTCIVSRATFYSAPGNNMQVGANSSGGTNNNLTVYDGSIFTVNGTLTIGNSSYHLYDGINMGGPGNPSTGFAQVVRSASNPTNHFGNFMTVSNAYFSCWYLNPQGPGEVFSVLANGTWEMTNSLTIGSASHSNSINMGGNTGSPGQSFLVVNGGTLKDINTADNGGGVSLGGVGNITLIVTNGGQLLTSMGTIGAGTAGNTGIVAGATSLWDDTQGPGGFINIITVGTGAAGGTNFMGVFDGATLNNGGTFAIGDNGFTAVVNTVVFGGPGLPVFVNNSGSLNIGSSSGSYSNLLVVTNANVTATTINVGNSGATNNILRVNGGTITVTYMRVRPTNSVVFSAGTLEVGGLSFDSLANWTSDAVTNPLVVGDGVSAAYYDMAAGGIGYHDFHDGGVVISANASLRGNGTINGNVTVNGTFVPGFAGSVGSVFSSNRLSFGSSAMLDYDLGTLSDSVTVSNNLGLGGTLNITDAGGFGIGTYTIFSYGGSLTNTGGGTLTVGTKPLPLLTYVINTNTLGSVLLQVTSGTPPDPYTTWVSYYGLSGGSALGTADPSHDGMSNTNKFMAGFSPTNSAAYLHIISIARATTNIVVTYLGANGDNSWSPGSLNRTNVLEFTTGTANGSYATNNFATTGQTNILSGGNGSGTITSFVDTNAATSSPSRYYRVRVLVP